ncbi:hypothetical protein WJX84_005430, partial [Apatococcus fuscideae]
KLRRPYSVLLTQPHLKVNGADDPPSTPRSRARAGPLEGRGVWHAVSLSAAQQVLGPLRARADARLALHVPGTIPQDETGRRTIRAFADTASQVRTSLLDTALGLDYIWPGSQGLARAGVWYSPKRKEAMAELRLF